MIDDLFVVICVVKWVLCVDLFGYVVMFCELEGDIVWQVDVICCVYVYGYDVILVVLFVDIVVGSVDLYVFVVICMYGVVVICGVFDVWQVSDWNDEIGVYLDVNCFVEWLYVCVEDCYFGNFVLGKLQIYGVYWLKLQVVVCQLLVFMQVCVFLNCLWWYVDGVCMYFDFDQVFVYVDWICCWLFGLMLFGLLLYVDGGFVECWFGVNFWQVYCYVLVGCWCDYDLFDVVF